MDVANHLSILDMIDQPAFCVRDGVILRANRSAQSHLFREGCQIADFLFQDAQAYADFQGGCLYLNVTSANITSGASVTRIEDFDLFVVDAERPQLEAFGLAAAKLKIPTCNLVNLADAVISEDPRYAAMRGQLRQQIYQISRIVNNMSDINWLREEDAGNHENTEFSSFFAELMEKMQYMTTAAGYMLEFENLPQNVSGLADRELLQRAVSNILSNAIKFSPKDSLIRAQLVQKGKYLHFTVTDPGHAQNERCNVFTNFTRFTAVEDGRNGLGLGMAIIHCVASCHGGTVLVDTPPEGGTRVTMTIHLRKRSRLTVRTTIQLPATDYTAGLDPALVEFADVLSAEAFEKLT